jgi:hypothetical protein
MMMCEEVETTAHPQNNDSKRAAAAASGPNPIIGV